MSETAATAASPRLLPWAPELAGQDVPGRTHRDASADPFAF